MTISLIERVAGLLPLWICGKSKTLELESIKYNTEWDGRGMSDGGEGEVAEGRQMDDGRI